EVAGGAEPPVELARGRESPLRLADRLAARPVPDREVLLAADEERVERLLERRRVPPELSLGPGAARDQPGHVAGVLDVAPRPLVGEGLHARRQVPGHLDVEPLSAAVEAVLAH